jgi:hypothetical protein
MLSSAKSAAQNNACTLERLSAPRSSNNLAMGSHPRLTVLEGGLVVEFVVDVCSNFIHQEAGHLQRERLTLGESSGELVSGVAPGPGTSDGEAAQQGDPIEVAGQAFPLGSCWILSSSSNKPCKPEVCMACTTRSLAEAEASSSDPIPSSIVADDIVPFSVGRDAALKCPHVLVLQQLGRRLNERLLLPQGHAWELDEEDQANYQAERRGGQHTQQNRRD